MISWSLVTIFFPPLRWQLYCFLAGWTIVSGVIGGSSSLSFAGVRHHVGSDAAGRPRHASLNRRHGSVLRAPRRHRQLYNGAEHFYGRYGRYGRSNALLPARAIRRNTLYGYPSFGNGYGFPCLGCGYYMYPGIPIWFGLNGDRRGDDESSEAMISVPRDSVDSGTLAPEVRLPTNRSPLSDKSGAGRGPDPQGHSQVVGEAGGKSIPGLSAGWDFLVRGQSAEAREEFFVDATRDNANLYHQVGFALASVAMHDWSRAVWVMRKVCRSSSAGVVALDGRRIDPMFPAKLQQWIDVCQLHMPLDSSDKDTLFMLAVLYNLAGENDQAHEAIWQAQRHGDRTISTRNLQLALFLKRSGRGF